MKTTLALIALSTLSLSAHASIIECHDLRTKAQVLYLADDMGSITTGHIDLNDKSFALQEGPGYSYYYGEFLHASVTQGEDSVELVAVAQKNGKFLGKLHYVGAHSESLSTVTCEE